MRVHILGICGTFMAGIALLAREQGHQVSGSDQHVYPPMSTQLAEAGIAVREGYDPAHLDPAPDVVVVGNALSRGNPAVEYLLDHNLPYTSGPQWLAEHILRERWVLAVAGTHGKTSTSAMLAWILEQAGLCPGFLIGGLPGNFNLSARTGDSAFFVVEADEYDTAFFDKRSKFVHYRPRTLVLNNLEYDHADIFPDLGAIQTQFHHLLRTVPGSGLIVAPAGEATLAEVLARGCWTPVEYLALAGELAGEGAQDVAWQARLLCEDGSHFEVWLAGMRLGEVAWRQFGRHNVHNALAAIAAARHAGVPPAMALDALGTYVGVHRRMEMRGVVRGVTVYDDFAHHPTAIATTLAGLRARVGSARILAVLEPRSNTMRLGVHAATLGPALAVADRVWLYRPADLDWDVTAAMSALGTRVQVFDALEPLLAAVSREARAGDHVLVMSNGGFGGFHEHLLEALHQGDTA